MKKIRMAVIVAAASLFAFSAASVAADLEDQEDDRDGVELSVMGGVQALNENDTALPESFVNIPAVAAITYPLTRILAIEGEFTWMIPIQQSVDFGSGGSQDLKTPDILAYQANLRANLPVSAASLAPYLAAGLGGVTFLPNTDADRLPQLDESETAFAINFGTGVTYRMVSHWGVRADFREFVAFPSKDAAGLSDGDEADPIWMERGTIGVAYAF